MPVTGSVRGAVLAILLFAPVALAANLVLAFGVAREAILPTVAIAFLPALAVLFGALTAAHRHILVFAGLALNLSLGPLNDQVLGPLFIADILVLLAVGSWLASGLLGLRTGERPPWPDTPVLGWPLLLFAVPLFWAVGRGIDTYGSAPLGGPIRLIVYAGIACALAGASPRQLYRGIVAVFYVGTIWMFFNAVYHVARGTSQAQTFDISTEGTRVLALTVSLNLAIALFLALLNLQVDHSFGRRLLHLVVAGLASFGVVVGYGRGVYVAVAFVLVVLFVGVRRVRGALASALPLAVPFLLVGVLLVPRVMPEFVPTFVNRITAPLAEDRNVRFRQEANAASLEVFRESPVTGVGFGRNISFTLDGKPYDLRQGSHNSLLWLLTGTGLLGLGAFALICFIFVGDAWRRLRGAVDPREKVLIMWAVAALAAIIIDSATMQIITNPSTLITVWILLLLPSVVPRRQRVAVAQEEQPGGPSPVGAATSA